MPAPVFSRLKAPVMAPLTVREEPLTPVPTTFHRWFAPRTTGALMVMAPASAATSMPSVAAVGVRVRIPGVSVPGAILTEVTPLGLAANSRSLMLKFAFRVVAIVGLPAVLALKMTRSFTPGRPLALVPARSVAKLPASPLFADQLPSPKALDQ